MVQVQRGIRTQGISFVVGADIDWEIDRKLLGTLRASGDAGHGKINRELFGTLNQSRISFLGTRNQRVSTLAAADKDVGILDKGTSTVWTCGGGFRWR